MKQKDDALASMKDELEAAKTKSEENRLEAERLREDMK